MTRDWSSLVLVALILGGLFAAIGVKAVRERTIARINARLAPYEQRLHDEAVIRQSLVDEAEYLVRDQRPWPCDHEDGWCSGECLEYSPQPPIVAAITDLPEPADPWWTQ